MINNPNDLYISIYDFIERPIELYKNFIRILTCKNAQALPGGEQLLRVLREVHRP